MSSKSKTLFQGLPKCSQVPADGVSFDSGTLTLLLKMRAVGCLIPQCDRSPKTERGRRVASSAVMANGHQISVVPLPPSSSTVVSVRRSARPSIRGGLSAARRHRAGGLISANCVRESPALFCSPSLEPRRRWKGKGRGTEGMSAPTRPSHSLSCVPILSLF